MCAIPLTAKVTSILAHNYEGKIVKEIYDTPYKFLFVSDSPFMEGWNCGGLAPRNRGYKLKGFGETDMVWAEPLLFNRLE